jgi:hypothetical protein
MCAGLVHHRCCIRMNIYILVSSSVVVDSMLSCQDYLLKYVIGASVDRWTTRKQQAVISYANS